MIKSKRYENIDSVDSLGFIKLNTKGVSGSSTAVAEGGVCVVVFVLGVWPVKKNQGENSTKGKSGKKMTIKETEGEVIETEKLIPYLLAHAR